MESVKQLMEEEKALEELLSGTPSKEASTSEEATTVEQEDNSAPVKVEGSDDQKPKPVEPEAKPEDTEEWEKRYKNLRAAREKKLYDAQKALADSQVQIAELHTRIEELEKLVVPVEVKASEVLTEEERETLGDEQVAAIEKLAKATSATKITSLEEELATIRENNKKAAEEKARLEQSNAYNTFLQRLQRVFPDYEQLNTDEGFITYLSETDTDGAPRFDNFRAAERRGDAASVGRYMSDYTATKAKPVEDKLAEHVAPKTSNVSTTSTSSEGDFITMKEINEHYDKHARGKYKGREKEFLEMEQKIDEYAARGKIKR